MEKSILTKNQKIKVERRKINFWGENCYIYPTIRYDDECGNGHNTFSITCDIKNTSGGWQAGGCLHDEFANAYPEYAHLIKWHLCSSNEPLYYLENTLYHANTSTSSKYKAGEPNKWEKRLKFKDSNIAFKFDEDFLKFLDENKKSKNFEVVEVAYSGKDDYSYSPNYSFKNFACDWYNAPFKYKVKAEEFKQGINSKDFEIVEIVTGYQEGKEPDYDACRACAIWLDASDDEFKCSQEELKQKLIDRLPKLMEEFKKDIEALGFTY